MLVYTIKKKERRRSNFAKGKGKYFKTNKVRTNRKRFSVSYVGVKLWNSPGNNLKQT